MNERSPFASDRFERSKRHSYFLHPEIYQEVIRDSPTNIYLIGPRGTGKTTLLQALHWRERLDNPSLQAALGADIFDSPSGPFLGVYLKLPEFMIGVIENWLATLDRHLSGPLLSLYFDLLWVEALSTAIAELLADGVFHSSPDAERAAVAALSTRYQGTFGRRGRRLPRTVAELTTAVLDLRREIERTAKVQEPHNMILQYDVVDQIGAFGRKAGEVLEPLCRTSSYDEPWHFRICMDEGETLSEFQVLVLNSMVRAARAPIVFVVSFVSMPSEVHETLINKLTLSAVDREIVSFDKLVTKKRFREFAEGVATVRLRSRKPELSFDVYRCLGKLDINGLLQRILERSVSPDAKALLQRARELGESELFTGDTRETQADVLESDEGNLIDDDGDEADLEETTAPPIYQAYLIDQLKLSIPSSNAPWRKRRQSSAELRKRMVAAYLAICSMLSATEPRYASAPMVLRLSDLCVRDFLRFLDHIFREFGGTLEEFTTGTVSVEVQDKAIKDASGGKARSVRRSGVTSPREISMLVRGLGRLTRILQTRGSQQEHLLSSERGLYLLPLHGLPPARHEGAYRQIREASEAGFLRITSLSLDEVRFRLHASLAPEYQLSYRGAYYTSPMSWVDMEVLIRAQTDNEVDALADRIGRRLVGGENLPLFPELEDA